MRMAWCGPTTCARRSAPTPCWSRSCYANNEIGTIQPLAALGAICHERGVPLHTDAVQAAGSLALNVDALNVDLLTLAAHKFYGPKGVGALYVRRGTPLLPQINGGGQERRRRAGTENVAGIVGMATALRLAEERRPAYAADRTALRDRLIAGVLDLVPYSSLNGHPLAGCPIMPISRSSLWRARACCCCSTSMASRHPAARPKQWLAGGIACAGGAGPTVRARDRLGALHHRHGHDSGRYRLSARHPAAADRAAALGIGQAYHERKLSL